MKKPQLIIIFYTLSLIFITPIVFNYINPFVALVYIIGLTVYTVKYFVEH